MSTTAFAFESLEISGNSQHLTPSLFMVKDGIAEKAFITCEGEVRYRYDGGEPTPLEGHLLRDGGYLILHGELQIKNFRAINATSQPSKLAISYERE